RTRFPAHALPRRRKLRWWNARGGFCDSCDGRIKALIANSPIIDLYNYMAGFIGPDFAANPPPVSLNEVDEISDEDFPREAKLSFKAACRRFGVDSFTARSEEHTSELQSRENLVCRLLLEKKK